MIQRLITSQVLDGKGAKYVVETMWMLMEANIEEVSWDIVLIETLQVRVTLKSSSELRVRLYSLERSSPLLDIGYGTWDMGHRMFDISYF